MASNTYTKNYADGSALTEAKLDTAYQTLQLDISNTALATTGSTTGQALISNGSGVAASFQTLSDPLGPFALRNYGLKATVATGVMTVSLKTKALATPSGTDIVDFTYSTNGTTSASYSAVQIAQATTIAVNASASLGFAATSATRVFVYGYYSSAAAAVKLAVSLNAYLDNGAAVTTVAISASSDNSTSIYASAALTVVPRLLGWVQAAHNSAGAWQTPTKVDITQHGDFIASGRIGSQTATMGVGGVALSGNSGIYQSTSTSYADITNLSVTLTTTGRPVLISLVSSNTASTSTLGQTNVGCSWSSSTLSAGQLKLLRGTSTIGLWSIVQNSSASRDGLLPSIIQIDAPNNAGSYTYKLQGRVVGGPGTLNVIQCKLTALEI